MEKRNSLNNVLAVVYRGWCTGCGTCIAFCPSGALEIEYTKGGAYVPKLIKGRCTGCRLCIELCPAANENFNKLNHFIHNRLPNNRLTGNYIDLFTGYSADESLRWKATSGGIATTLLLFALREGLIDGALLTKISSKNSLQAAPFIARTEEEIYSCLGAKYVAVPLNILLKQLLNEKGRFAVVGLPCHLWGIRRAELRFPELREKIVYHIGLVCSHTMGVEGVKFVLEKMSVSPEKIHRLSYRGEGWPSGLKVRMKDGSEKYMPNLNSWWSEIFGGYFFSHYYCTICSDHLNEFSDISLADAWLRDIVEKDNIGTSIVITRTNKGNELIEKAVEQKQIQIFNLTLNEVIRSQLVPILFKKRNIRARLNIYKCFGRKKMPPDLVENESTFIKPTIFDYVGVFLLCVNRFISHNKLFRKILRFVPFSFLRVYRITFKLLIALKGKIVATGRRKHGS